MSQPRDGCSHKVRVGTVGDRRQDYRFDPLREFPGKIVGHDAVGAEREAVLLGCGPDRDHDEGIGAEDRFGLRPRVIAV